MPYINSKNIAAFPVVNRNSKVSDDIYARHTSEEVLSGIVNKLISTDGFVITQKDNFKLTSPFMFNIHGYYFKIAQLQSILNLFTSASPAIEIGDTVYGVITLETNGQWTELAGDDITDDTTPTTSSVYYYTGVQFILVKSTDTAPVSTTTTYYLPLFKYVGSGSSLEWNNTSCYVDSESYIKFITNKDVIISAVDGGDLG